MKNFLVKMAYNGAAYHGFQRQNNATAIQQVVEEAIESLTGQQVAPTTWIGDTLTTSEDVRQAFADGPGDNRMPGGAYHNQFWFPFPDSHAFLALGIHGQMIYMNPGADVLGVKLSSWGLPQDAGKLFPTIRAFEALAKAVNSPAAE